MYQVFRNIEDAVNKEFNPQYDSDHRYVAGVDWGRNGDYTVISVIDLTDNQLVSMDRFNGIGWNLQRGRLREMADVWKPDVIWAESSGIGRPNIEALWSDGLPMRAYQTTSRSIMPLIESLALGIERGELGLLNERVLLQELAACEIEQLPHGRYRFRSGVKGVYQNTVIATALAWHGRTGGIRVEFA